MNENELILIYGKDIEAMTRRLLEEADLKSLIPSHETRIGIKPNMVSPSPPEDGATTHPEIIGALIAYLQENEFTNISVMEGSWVGDLTSDAYDICGYDSVIRKYHVPFIDMQKEKSIARDCAGMELNICEAVENVDFLINVPVLKGHCQTKITCALKNMKGLLPNSEKRRFHRLGLHEPIGHLSAGIRQDFILVDSICGDLTFEDGGNPVYQGRLIAACDPVLCDAFCCSLIGLDPGDVDYIHVAARLGVGEMDLSKASVIMLTQKSTDANNDKIVYTKTDQIWEKTKTEVSQIKDDTIGGYRHVCHLADNVCEVESCSACYGCLIPALHKLEKEGLLSKLRERIFIGQGYRGKTGKLGVGNCTRKFQHSLAGCPPTEEEMYYFLKDYILSYDGS